MKITSRLTQDYFVSLLVNRHIIDTIRRKNWRAFVIIITLFFLYSGKRTLRDRSFQETFPFTWKRQPSEPKGHHLHAKRVVSQLAMLKSSMVSGHLGNLRRHQPVRARAEQVGRSVLGAATLFTEYVDLLRRYEQVSDLSGEGKETEQVGRRRQIAGHFAGRREEQNNTAKLSDKEPIVT